jgi:hypothetical protein
LTAAPRRYLIVMDGGNAPECGQSGREGSFGGNDLVKENAVMLTIVAQAAQAEPEWGPRIFGALVLGLGAILLAVMTGWLLRFLFKYFVSLPLPETSFFSVARQPQSTLGPEHATDHKARARLTFEIQRLSPAERRLAGICRLEVPDALKRQLWDFQVKQAVATWEGTSPPALQPQYQDAFLHLTILNRLHLPVVHKRIPLQSLFARPGYQNLDKEDFADPFDVPLDGMLVQYPSDWYWLNALVYIELPKPFILSADGLGGAFYLPLEIRVAYSPGLEGKELIAVHQAANASPEIQTLEVRIKRDRATRFFTYALALVPLALGVLLGHLLFLHPESAGLKTNEVLMGAAVILLAVLPLRPVLVPAEIPVLTRVDILLGYSIVLIVSLVFIKYGIELLR